MRVATFAVLATVARPSGRGARQGLPSRAGARAPEAPRRRFVRSTERGARSSIGIATYEISVARRALYRSASDPRGEGVASTSRLALRQTRRGARTGSMLMNQEMIVRTWEDPEYRASLAPEIRASLPASPCRRSSRRPPPRGRPPSRSFRGSCARSSRPARRGCAQGSGRSARAFPSQARGSPRTRRRCSSRPWPGGSRGAL